MFDFFFFKEKFVLGFFKVVFLITFSNHETQASQVRERSLLPSSTHGKLVRKLCPARNDSTHHSGWHSEIGYTLKVEAQI